MRVIMDPQQMSQLGINQEVGIDLPDRWGAYTAAQRRSWARSQVEVVALGLLRDLAAMHGRMPTAEEEAAYMASIQPGIDEALEGVGR